MGKKREWNDIIKAKRGKCFKDDNGSRLRKGMCQLDVTVNSNLVKNTSLWNTRNDSEISRLKRESVRNNLKKVFLKEINELGGKLRYGVKEAVYKHLDDR